MHVGHPQPSLAAWPSMADSPHSGFSLCSPASVATTGLCGVSAPGNSVFSLAVAPSVMATFCSAGVSGARVTENIAQTTGASFGVRFLI